MELLDQIKENAKKQNKTIVLPEGTEERTIQAANQIIGEGIAKIILIGNPSEIKALAEKYQLKNIDKASIIDPQTHAKKEHRLAFAIATIGIPDILIVDEVLSVGDFRFQEKCEARIQNMKDQGTTILFVSHSIEQVKKICNKVVWLDHGVLKMFGDAQEICSIYEKA